MPPKQPKQRMFPEKARRTHSKAAFPMPLPKIEPLFAVAWLGVYFCRVVLIVNGIIYSTIR